MHICFWQAYAAGCNIVILAGNFERVQIIPGVAHGNIKVTCIDCSTDTGKVCEISRVCVCVCVCNQLCICWYKQFLNYATKKKPIGLHVVILFPVSFISTKFLKHRIFLEKKELTVTIKQWMPWYNHPGWLGVKHQVTYHKNSRSVPVPYIAA